MYITRLWKPTLSMLLLLGLSWGVAVDSARGQWKPNYDESRVPAYTLPDSLLAADGGRIETAAEWEATRRGEILQLFETWMYGRTPEQKIPVQYKTTSVDRQALGGKAIRKEVSIIFGEEPKTVKMDLLIYLPAKAEGPVPMFLGLNFQGNHTISADPGITITKNSIENPRNPKPMDLQTAERTRGIAADRWPVEMIVDRGYGLATAYYGDIDPDFDDGFQNGIHPLFYEPGQTRPRADQWGSIGAWAWGLSRALDYLETDADVDARRVAVLGHSRLGKTSLWAGAQDPRFALVISNDSGCGGAALSRRAFGETVWRINTSFPHWFCDNFKKFNDNEGELPIDQHELIALMAPRPVYVASAEEDQWADPRGEFLSALNAAPVYRLYGEDTIAAEEMPEVEQPVVSRIGYHVRRGKHDVTDYDWARYLDFADKYMKAP